MTEYVYFKTTINGFSYKVKSGKWIRLHPGVVYKAKLQKLKDSGMDKMKDHPGLSQLEKLMCIKDKNVEVLP